MENGNKECFKLVRQDVSISGCLVSYGTNDHQRKIQQLPIVSCIPTAVQNYKYSIQESPLNLSTSYCTSNEDRDLTWYYSTCDLNMKHQPNVTDCSNFQMNGSLGYDSTSSSPEMAVSPPQPVTFRSRSNFFRHQVVELESFYGSNPQPSRYERYLLSKRVGLSENQVKHWFQNRRTRAKKKEQRLRVNLEELMEDIKILTELTGEEVVDVIREIDEEEGKGD